ncbi:hypothetical protein, partial [Pseudomonas sp. IPO3778]|uniref:hypothetical protein n=1 Tax=Pseudomonas sp. IPO3778 TaxID=2726976 RepID=UPI001C4D5C44
MFKDVGDQLWELSSFSEAAMADYQATSLSADRASSQPRWGSTAPTLDWVCLWERGFLSLVSQASTLF